MRIILGCVFLISGQIQAQSIEQLSWLVGNWRSTTNELVFSENWLRPNDSSLVGTSTITKGHVEQFAEKLKIEVVDGQLCYIAILTEKTAVFALDKVGTNSVSFLDPKNDFPSRITYVKTAKGMDIILEGNDATNPQVEIIHYLKN